MAISEIYLVHHSHTDLGFTHAPSTAFELLCRNIDIAIELAEASADRPDGNAFRWTCETTIIVEAWLRCASARQIDRFVKLCQQGRIDVAALWCNLTATYETEQLYRTLEPVRRLREMGIAVRGAMNCDVNGLPWRIVDLLAESGIDGITMASNGHMGRTILSRPSAFNWRGPAGNRVAVWNGYLYNDCWFHGIPNDIDAAQEKLGTLINRLEASGYPHSFLQFQATYPDYSDNGPPDARLSDFVTEWNRRGLQPAMRIVTLSGFIDRLKQADLPEYAGEWVDAWAFGSGSCARVMEINRANHARLLRSDLLHTVGGFAEAAATSDEALRAISLFDEHTFGADECVPFPHSVNSLTQWSEKSAYAFKGNALTLRLEKDGLINLVSHIAHGGKPGVLLFNPSASTVEAYAQAPLHWFDPPYPMTESHLHALRGYGQRARSKPIYYTGPIALPAWGYRWVPADEWSETLPACDHLTATEILLESPELRVTLDAHQGGIESIFDKTSQRELLEKGDSRGARLVHESVAEPTGREAYFQHNWSVPNIDSRTHWQTDWEASRVSDSSVIETRIERHLHGVSVIQRCRAHGVTSLEYRYTLYRSRPGVEVAVTMTLTGTTEPNALYLDFPLAIEKGTFRYEALGTTVEFGREHLPETTADFISAQRWVDLSNDKVGVTILTPDVPLWMYGGYHFGRITNVADDRSSRLVAWPVNNYWDTNFPVSQSGEVHARFTIIPHGRFDSAEASRQADRATQPTLITTGVGRMAGTLPTQGQLLKVQSTDAVPVALRRIDDKRLLLRIENCNSAAESKLEIASGVLSVENVSRADPLGNVTRELAVTSGICTAILAPRELATFIITVALNHS